MAVVNQLIGLNPRIITVDGGTVNTIDVSASSKEVRYKIGPWQKAHHPYPYQTVPAGSPVPIDVSNINQDPYNNYITIWSIAPFTAILDVDADHVSDSGVDATLTAKVEEIYATVGDEVVDFATGLATGTKVVTATDTLRSFVNNSGVAITLTADTEAGVILDGLELYSPGAVVIQSGQQILLFLKMNQ